MIGAKTHPEFSDLALWQVARGMKSVVLKGDGGSRKRSESKIHRRVIRDGPSMLDGSSMI
jgi:hypothetical protein